MVGRVGLVLSAGASSRWQGEPKALLRIGPESALERIVRLLEVAGVPRIRVVVGAHADRIRAAVAPSLRDRIEWLAHPEWASGRTGSVGRGLVDLSDEEVVLWPVDHPLVAPGTLPSLLAVADRDLIATWILPQYGGRGGHPVVLKSPAWRLVAELRPDEPLNRLLPRLGPAVRRVPVDDPAVVVNLNTPEAYWEARGAGLPKEEGERWTGN